MRIFIPVVLAAAFANALPCDAAEREETAGEQNSAVDFSRDIQPIFAARCYECHGDDSREGGLRLTNRRDAFTPADSGDSVLVAGDSQASTLLARVLSRDESEQMPPEGERLSAQEVNLLRRWIEAGADWPVDDDSLRHWAYIRPTRPMPPRINDATAATNPIDAFIQARLDMEGLRPTQKLDKSRLIRRASLTLIGLPPSVEEVDAFLADSRPDAYERLVDRLLESPWYGERWARPWLDLARYADSNGYQADQIRESWAYRDWVIEALNDDMPFDQFVIEQLAGDLLPGATIDQRIATGFHRTVTCNVEAGVHPEQNRTNQIFDRVNTTGTVFLGTTIECCQCHNHKYDPFTQTDYYRLFAYFNNTPLEVENTSGVTWDFYGPKMDLPLRDDQLAEQTQLRTELAALRNQREKASESSSERRAEWEQELLMSLENPARWQPLNVISFRSTGGEEFSILEDHSVLIGGTLPDTSVYTVTLELPGDPISGLKLEALTHDSLPGRGPGRGDAKRTNFVLNEFEAEIHGTDKPRGIGLIQPKADFSQQRWNVAQAIDGERNTGWAIAPQFHEPHWATFRFKNSYTAKPGDQLVVTLDQNFGRGRTLGRVRISALVGNPAATDLPERIAKILKREKKSEKEQQQLTDFFNKTNPQLERIDAEIAAIEKRLKGLKPPSTLVMVEMEKPRETHVLLRGDYLNPGKKVVCGTPETLPSIDPKLPANRLGLANWLVSPENPLVARVAVNRWWAQIFGQGIVPTLEDFGTQSEPPTHPELLDWLACELVENGWSMKQIHRLIVTSEAFQRSARTAPDLWSRDPTNKLLARGPRFRLPAESIRDNALAISGLLSDKMGGPPVMPFQPEGIWRAVGRNAPKWVEAQDENRYRRGIYVVWRRAAPYPSFVNFDAPDRAACVVSRPRTNTPLQALTLLNDPVYVEAAMALAERVIGDLPTASSRQRAEYAMRLCVARQPTDEEIDDLTAFFQEEVERLGSDSAAVDRVLKHRMSTKAVSMPDRVTLAAWFHVANVLLNLDETITP